MHNAVLLAAGIGELLEWIVPPLFVAIWLVSRVFAAFRKEAKAQPAVRPPQVRPAPLDPRGGLGRPVEVDREIEKLLKRTLGVEPARQPPPLPRQPKQRQQKQKSKKQGAGGPSRLDARDTRESRGSDVSRHVEEAFAHDLAHESPSGTASQSVAAIAASPSADLIASLRSPEDIRRLMIVREILDVPSHRW